jgi:hypothetical protein
MNQQVIRLVSDGLSTLRPQPLRLSGYQVGTRVPGNLEATYTSLPAQAGVIYEDFSVPDRALTSDEITQMVNNVYTQKWFQGAQVTWVYADPNQFRCQFSYPVTPTAQLIEPATIIAIITAIGVIISAVATLVWAMTAYKLVTTIPPESFKYLIPGAIIIGITAVTAYLIRAIRGR